MLWNFSLNSPLIKSISTVLANGHPGNDLIWYMNQAYMNVYTEHAAYTIHIYTKIMKYSWNLFSLFFFS